MINRMYDIMSDLNEIVKDINSIVEVLEIESKGVRESNSPELPQSLLNVHKHLLKGIQEDTSKLYTKIDETILDIKYERI